MSFQRFAQMPRVRGCITLRPKERPLTWLQRVAGEGPDLPHGLLATTPEGFPVRDLGENLAPPRRFHGIGLVADKSYRIAWYLRSARLWSETGGILWCCDYPANKEGRAIVYLFPVDLGATQEPSK